MTEPLKPPSDIGSADPETLEKYNAALDAQVKALENRGGTNWFNIAAAFANPGRTGSFGEAFGNAMGVVGKQRETDEAQALPIAQMRASLVGQKYQMQKEQESNKALINALGGGNPADIMQTISSPQGAFGNPQLYHALVRAQMQAQPGTSAAAKIDKLLETQQKQLKLGIDMGTLDVARVASQFQYGPSAGNTSGGTGTVAPTAQTAGQPNAQPNATPNAPQRVAPPEFKEEPTPRDSLVNTLANTFKIDPKSLSTTRTREEQQSIFARWKKGEKGLYMPVDPSKFPDQKEFHSNAIDVPTSVDEGWMNANGWYRPFPKADPVHYEPIVKGTPAPNTAAAPAASTAAATPAASSTESPKTEGGWTLISPGVYKMEGTNRVEKFASTATPEAIQKRLLESAKAEHEQTLKLEAAQKEAELKALQEDKSKRAAPYQAQNATLAGYNYNTVKDSELKYKELIDLVRKNPDVVGTLVHQGPLYALLHSVQEGVRTPSGSLSLDVIGAINKLYQDENQQSAARNISQLISDLNQQVMKKGKDIFGPQISEYDAKKMLEPGFKTTDPAEFLIYLATKNDLLNRYMGKMADAQQDYFDVNPNATTGSFFNPKNNKSPYKSIVDEYADLNKQLIDASPYNRRGK